MSAISGCAQLSHNPKAKREIISRLTVCLSAGNLRDLCWPVPLAGNDHDPILPLSRPTERAARNHHHSSLHQSVQPPPCCPTLPPAHRQLNPEAPGVRPSGVRTHGSSACSPPAAESCPS